jgi:hypothetical protein
MSSDRVIIDAIKMARRLLWQNLASAHKLPDATTVMRLRDLVRSPAVQSALQRSSDRFSAFALRAVKRVLADRSRIDQRDVDSMNLRSSVAVTAAMLVAHPTAAQNHRFEADPVVTVRENFVACDVLSQLQRVIDNPHFLLAGECEPLGEGRRVRIYASRGPYVCIYPEDTIMPCKWTHEKVLSK